MKPAQIAHADWGVNPKKRWRANAVLADDGRYDADGPVLVGTSGGVLERMGVGAGTSLLGFDFPIGLPERFAEAAGITSFMDPLMTFGAPPWDRFFEVADHPAEITLYRPFYPRSSGAKGQHTRRAQLDALRLDALDLLRQCERAQEGLGAASSIFWTIGGQQVGKGALSGWKEMLVPLIADETIDAAIWPFDGTLSDLASERTVVIAETYPAALYRPLGVVFGAKDDNGKFGKTQRHDRLLQASRLIEFADRIGVRLSPRLSAAIEDGFGDRRDGEDKFDAVVGLLGMLALVTGDLPDATPYDDAAVTSVEGWIVGRRP
jgi:hypothetical protein